VDVVTGAFSFTGRAIAEELLDRGRTVRTLTRRDAPGDPLAARIERAELQFRDEEALCRALDGVDTLADVAVSDENVVLDAAGPETISFHELVRLVAAAVGSKARIVNWPARLVLALARATGAVRRDVLLTADEFAGPRANLLVSDNGEALGRGYVSELARNFRPYDPL
jgi:NAD(P)-dependent dehydrogenase (short-subunit alcohol dehydrogenase family)